MRKAAAKTEYTYCPQCGHEVQPMKDGVLWLCPKHGTDLMIPPPKVTTSSLIGTTNATFTIIAAKPGREAGLGEVQCEVVLGYRRLTGDYKGITVEYVTWIYNTMTKGYNLGHYTTDFAAAVKDYEGRC